MVANSGDAESLAAMARATRVVATSVGPYFGEGLALVDACVDAGADYVDLTGEVLFVRESIERDGKAVSTGARIVHSCGFDSIPSDLGVYLLYDRARSDGAGDLKDTTLVVTAMRGWLSGGTLASMETQIDKIKSDSEARRVAADPYALVPDGAPGADAESERDSFGVGRDEQLGQWVAPFVMASYNTRLVRRSNALQHYAYGRGFRYREVVGVGSGLLAPVKGAIVAGGLAALSGSLAFGPTRKLLDRVLPSPGEGPSEQARRKGYFRLEIHARTSSGASYIARVAANGDPGYAATALMMGEAALCLALDSDRLPQRGGILTPAAAMNGAIVERLQAAGMTLGVERA